MSTNPSVTDQLKEPGAASQSAHAVAENAENKADASEILVKEAAAAKAEENKAPVAEASEQKPLAAEAEEKEAKTAEVQKKETKKQKYETQVAYAKKNKAASGGWKEKVATSAEAIPPDVLQVTGSDPLNSCSRGVRLETAEESVPRVASNAQNMPSSLLEILQSLLAAKGQTPVAQLPTTNLNSFTNIQREEIARLTEENLNKTIELLATCILPELTDISIYKEELDGMEESDDACSIDSAKFVDSGDVSESIGSHDEEKTSDNQGCIGNVAHVLEAQKRTDDVRIEYSNPFRHMQLKDAVKKGLAKSGFVYPNFIQSAAIPLGTSGADLLIESKSGTGKTIMFTTVVLHRYNPKLKAIQALIVTPTREIAYQINGVLRDLGRCSHGFNPVCITGGNDIEQDRKSLARATAVVGTPGRLNHMLRRNCINLSHVAIFVIDEADKMCLPNFMSDLSIIRSHLPETKQTIACSATLPAELHEQLVSIMREPVFISSKNESPLLRGIKQFYLEVPDGNTTSKVAAVDNLMESFMFGQCIAFGRSQIRAEDYFNEFQRRQWSAKLITGAQSHEERLQGLEDYHTQQANVFVSTDLLARGVDANSVRLVINMDVPEDATTYLHRMGRAGRFGTSGVAVTVIASKEDRALFRKIIKELGVNRVLRYPKKYPNEHKLDIWDISEENFQAEARVYGLFDDAPPPVAPLASEEQMTTSGCQTGKVEIVYTHPRTDTFKVDSEHEQQVTSNTIDDASSIAADSMSSFHDPCIDWYDEHRAEIAKMMSELIKEQSEESKSPVMFDEYFDDFQKTVLDKMTEEERSMMPTATIKKRRRRAKKKKPDTPISDTEPAAEAGTTIVMETEEPLNDVHEGMLDSQSALWDETLKTGAADSSKTSPTDFSGQRELPLSDDIPSTSASVPVTKHYPSLAYAEKGCDAALVQRRAMHSDGVVVKSQFTEQKLTISKAVKIDIPPMPELPEHFVPKSGTADEDSASISKKHEMGASPKQSGALDEAALDAEIKQAMQLYWESLYWEQLTYIHEGVRKKLREQNEQQEGPGENQQ